MRTIRANRIGNKILYQCINRLVDGKKDNIGVVIKELNKAQPPCIVTARDTATATSKIMAMVSDIVWTSLKTQ